MDVTGILQYAAPLVKVYAVITSKCTKGLPLPLAIGTTFCSTCWTIYSIVENDMFLLLQNAVGALLSYFQLSLFCIYPFEIKPKKESEMSPIPTKTTPITEENNVINVTV